jgi:hypothetical protein
MKEMIPVAKPKKEKTPANHSIDLLAQAREAVIRSCRYVTQLGLNVLGVDWPTLIPRSIKDPGWRCLRSDVRKATVTEAMVLEGIYDPATDTLNIDQIQPLGNSR